ncbi:mechanosensitive ion channel family protein [Rhizobium sp. CG5]|nr:mechanosensitive ion channel family protein [Rhizobium sp. CG5]
MPLLSPRLAMAQDPLLTAPADPVGTAQTRIPEAQKQLDSLRASVEADAKDDTKLVDDKAKADTLARDMLQVTVDIRPRFEEIKTRLEQLGDAPKDGQPAEAPEVSDERSKLVAERLEINTLTGKAEDVSIGATQLSNAITKIRRELFANQILAHTDLSGAVLSEAWTSFGAEIQNFNRTVGSWLSFVWKFKRLQLGIAIMLSLAMALILLTAEYRLFGSLIKRDPAAQNPAYMSRFSVAFWSTILPTLAIAAFLLGSYFFLYTFNVLRPDIASIISGAFALIGLMFFVSKLTRAVLAPGASTWRLVRVSDRGARDLEYAILAMALINGADYVLGSISETLGSPVVLTVIKSLVSAVLVGLIIVIVSFMKPVIAKHDEASVEGRPWPRWVIATMRLTGAGLILAGLTGYVGLSRFLATQLILNGAVIATMYIGIRSGRAVSAPNQFGETLVGRFLHKRLALSPVALDQSGIVAGLLIYVFVLVIGIPLTLMSWGFQPRDLQLWFFNLFTEINLGNIRISIVGILGGVLLFALGLVATRWFQKWLDGNVMARSHVDTGVRNSVRTGIGYLGTGLATLIGISAAGIDLSSLALVAGALSLGIGFGLQNIVSNFVSGLILLVERPFKVGDWVATGTTEGFVRKISVRATEIETFQRQTIIVPNSELINASVGNWTHRNTLARVDILVGVSYDSDPRQVIRILTEIAGEQPGALRNPEPFVVFLSFGASSLDFQLSFYVADVLNSLGVKNETRIRIIERFRDEGIEMPFPHQDVRILMRAGEADIKRKEGADDDHAKAPSERLEAGTPSKQQPPVERGDLQDDPSDDTLGR